MHKVVSISETNLDSEWNPVAPFCRVVDQSLEDTGRDELANGPAEVDVNGEITSQG